MSKRNFYLSFGQTHAHAVDGKTFDKDCLCLIAAPSAATARQVAHHAFGSRWSMVYEESELAEVLLFFPRGVIALKSVSPTQSMGVVRH